MNDPIKQHILPEYQKAIEFCKQKSLVYEPLNYLLTVHNTSLKRDTHHIFQTRAGKNHIKVQIGGEVTEWYELDTLYEQEKVAIVSMLPDGTKTGVYRTIDKGVIKTPLDSNNEPTISNFVTSWNDVPAEIRAEASYFEYKHALRVWSDKRYGLILEYDRFRP